MNNINDDDDQLVIMNEEELKVYLNSIILQNNLIESGKLPVVPEENIQEIQESEIQYDSVHGMLKQWAVNPNIIITEDVVLRNSEFNKETGVTTELISTSTIKRRLSVKERIEAAKASADYFAPKLKSIESKVTTETADMSDEELLELAKSLILEDKVIQGEVLGQ